MRSSESANKERQGISVRIRYRPDSRNTLASAASQKAYSSTPQRARAARWRATCSASGVGMSAGPALLAGAASEQPPRPQDQHEDHDGIDDESPELGDVVLPGDVGDADQQRGHERAGNARCAAHGNDDQKVDHEFEGKGRIEAEDLGAERTAQPGEAGPESKCEGEYGVDVDAEPACHPRVVDRGAQPGPEARARENELQAERENAADHDDEQAVTPDADAEDLEPPLQGARDIDENLLRAHHAVDGGDRHEHEPDGEKHLLEVALAVDVGVERAFEQCADERGGHEGDGGPRKERHAPAVDQDQRDVAARHGEGAMGQVDEVHQPERDRKAAGQHEQQHAVGDAVEENCQHGRPPSPARRSLPYTDGGTGNDARPLPAAVVDVSRTGSRAAPGTNGRCRMTIGYFFIFKGSLTASNFANSTL